MPNHLSVHCSRRGWWPGHCLCLNLPLTCSQPLVNSVHLGIWLIISLSGCQDNWFARGLVFWTSISRHQGFLNMAKIEQKGMFAPRFCLSLFPSLRVQGQIQSPYFCQGSVLAYPCTSSTARSVSWYCDVHTLPPQGMRSCGIWPGPASSSVCYLARSVALPDKMLMWCSCEHLGCGETWKVT